MSTDQPAEPQRVIHEVCALIRHVLVNGGSDDGLHYGVDEIEIIANVTMYEHETYDPPPWVRHGIETQGWWIRHRPAQSTGLDFHGAVDWRALAVSLAAVIAQRTKPTPAEAKALDDYSIALSEEALGTDHPQEEPHG